MSAIRVAIIGSGPSAFYAADFLLKKGAFVDMFERLPTPFGLVRGGVAPDHEKIKAVTKVYERTGEHPNFRYFGGVEYGRDLHHDDLPRFYHAVIYATGAQTDRHLGIEGENLPGSHSATEFVGWYNGHPDFSSHIFDLKQTAAAVIGNGNVAMDVARILARTPQELASTDIADYALDALRGSQIKTIYILGRRGPAQAAYTTAEIKELGELADADVVVSREEAALDPLSAAQVEREADRGVIGNVEAVQRYAEMPPSGKSRQIVLRFLVSPVRLIGQDRVEAIEIVKNELVLADDGSSLRHRATGETECLPVGLVFRSIGYRGVPLEGVPFDERSGTIPNVDGRVIGEDGQPRTGEYVTGWIKRGPSGVVGTNKPDALETGTLLLVDAAVGKLWTPHGDPDELLTLLKTRGVDVVTFDDWHLLDQIETARGRALGRPRLKIARIDDMYAALHEARNRIAAAD